MDAEVYVWKSIERLSTSLLVQRWAKTIKSLAVDGEQRKTLVAVLLVECSARPRIVRIFEWSVAFVFRSGLLGDRARRRGHAITVGPLQMKAAPFNREAAVKAALSLLGKEREVLRSRWQLAELWNGPAANSVEQILPYGIALELAMPIAERILEQDSSSNSGGL